jgi:hypothetical protein
MAKPLDYADWPVVPLVIFWFAIARDGAAHPLTIQSRDVPTESEFPSIHLFSLSLHLRQMLPAAPFLHIEAPRNCSQDAPPFTYFPFSSACECPMNDVLVLLLMMSPRKFSPLRSSLALIWSTDILTP